MVCTLFKLPCGFVCEVLVIWISARDLLRTDSACASQETRGLYLNLVGSNMVVMKDPFNINFFESSIEWLNKRSMRILSVVVPNLQNFDAVVVLSRKSAQRTKYLDFEQCESISDEIFRSFTEHCICLRSILIGSEHNVTLISDRSLELLSTTSLNLKKIKLCQTPFITDASIEILCSSIPGLQDIELLRCGRLCDRSMAAIASNCLELRVLALSDNFLISSHAITNLVNKSDTLRELRLVRCSAILAEEERGASSSPGAAAPPPTSLEKLVISGIPVRAMSAFVRFLNRCTTLQSLFLQGVQNFSKQDVETIAPVLRGLSHLSLDSFPGMSSGTLEKLLGHCTALQSVSLHACHVLDPALRILGTANASTLTSCSVTWSRHITDYGLLAMARACPGLRSQSLNGCVQITSSAVQQLVTCCVQLESLVIPYCPKISPGVVASLRTQHPALVIDYVSPKSMHV